MRQTKTQISWMKSKNRHIVRTHTDCQKSLLTQLSWLAYYLARLSMQHCQFFRVVPILDLPLLLFLSVVLNASLSTYLPRFFSSVLSTYGLFYTSRIALAMLHNVVMRSSFTVPSQLLLSVGRRASDEFWLPNLWLNDVCLLDYVQVRSMSEWA